MAYALACSCGALLESSTGNADDAMVEAALAGWTMCFTDEAHFNCPDCKTENAEPVANIDVPEKAAP